MTVDEMIARKKEFGYSYEYIAEKSGVPVSTVQKVLSKRTSSPRYATLTALTKVFQLEMAALPQTDVLQDNQTGKGETNAYPSGNRMEGTGLLRESADGYPAFRSRKSEDEKVMVDGTGALDSLTVSGKTIQDYLALPEGMRVELIDGEFYDMAAPTIIHQRLCHLLGSMFEEYIDTNHGTCIPFVSPVDVQLDCDNKTMVQPDVFVVCDQNKLTKERVVGAPDLVVEILSPSTRYHDTVRKLLKYRKAGVREYWIVMPQQQRVLVYDFAKSDLSVEYSFADEVPVGIWDGACKVDFQKIYRKVAFLL
ncbi:MAG: Uma2 family endonuclease [Lachnospiraceae bacterium]|nr:Uma2 family endonuclease [Lachnospiraceae bacterium]